MAQVSAQPAALERQGIICVCLCVYIYCVCMCVYMCVYAHFFGMHKKECQALKFQCASLNNEEFHLGNCVWIRCIWRRGDWCVNKEADLSVCVNMELTMLLLCPCFIRLYLVCDDAPLPLPLPLVSKYHPPIPHYSCVNQYAMMQVCPTCLPCLRNQ